MAAVRKIYAVLDTDPDLTDAPDAEPLPERARRAGVQPRDLLLRQGPRRGARRELPGAARRHGGARRPHRRRQEHADQAAGALLRPERRRGAHRRARPDAGDHEVAARADGDRAAGGVPVQRLDHGQHPFRTARGGRRRGPPGGAYRRRPRLHRGPAGRLRHGRQRGRLGPLNGSAAADQLCPARCSPTRASSSWTKPPAAWTPRASSASSAPWTVLFSGRTSIIVAHRSEHRCATPTRSSSSTTTGLWAQPPPELVAAEGRYWRLYEQWERTGEAL